MPSRKYNSKDKEKLIIDLPSFQDVNPKYFKDLKKRKGIIDHLIIVVFKKNEASLLSLGYRIGGMKLFSYLTKLTFAISHDNCLINPFCFLIKSTTSLRSVAIKSHHLNFPFELLLKSIKESEVQVFKLLFSYNEFLTIKQSYILAKLQQSKLLFLMINDVKSKLFSKILLTYHEIISRINNNRYLQLCDSTCRSGKNHSIRSYNFLADFMSNILISCVFPSYIDVLKGLHYQYHLVDSEEWEDTVLLDLKNE